MRELLQSSTGEVILFYMVDSTDHVTEKTGLSVTVTLSKNGGSFAAAAGAVAEVGNGLYKLTPTTADTGTLGPLAARATGTAADPCVTEINIVSNDPYVALNNAITAPTAVQIRDALVAVASSFKANVSGLSTHDAAAVVTALQAVAASFKATGFATPGAAMILTAPATAALAIEIEAELVNDTTGEALRQAIVDKIIENLPDLDALTIAAIRDDLERVGGSLAVIKGKTDQLAFASGDVKSTLDSETVTVENTSACKADVSALSTHDAAAVVTALQAVAASFKATGFSTHDAAAVVTALQVVASSFKADVSALSTHDAAAVITAMMAKTGITAGGTWSLEKVMKVTLALACQSVRDKAGTDGAIQEVLDPENGSTVIAEITPGDTTPYRSISVS